MAGALVAHDLSIVGPPDATGGTYAAGLYIKMYQLVADTGQETTTKLLQFQFPPKVTNDSRDGEWEEKSAGAYSGDKVAIYKAAGPRRITMEWKYVVGFANWSASIVKSQIQLLRGYFRNPFIGSGPPEGAGGAASPMVVLMDIWDIGGGPSAKPAGPRLSFRLHSANIKHGNTLVGTRPSLFPFYTEISAEFRSWTQVGIDKPAQIVTGQTPYTVSWF